MDPSPFQPPFDFVKQFLPYLVGFARNPTNRQKLKVLLWLFLALAILVAIYSVLFHVLMAHEGRNFSWFTGIYWTLTLMSTLGFGDIVFTGDLGRVFSMFVLLSGTAFMLILLPFTFIQFFYMPWMEAQSASRTPRRLPEETHGHVVLTYYDPVTSALIHKLTQYRYPYVLVVADPLEASRLYDLGLRVVVGDLDNPETYRKIRIEKAALVAMTARDPTNTSLAFTVRETSEAVPIIATARDPASVDILELAGCSRVLQLGEMMGQSLARHARGGRAPARPIGQFSHLLIAKATAAGTSLVGKTLEEIGLPSRVGVTVVGIWERGEFKTARPETRVGSGAMLVLAGSQGQLEKYNQQFRANNASDVPVIIIGGGRVGRAAGRTLEEQGIDYLIVEQLPERVHDTGRYILGNAAELGVLKQAGITEAPTVLITTREDETNIYLTIYCRHLRPDIQIIGRATLERNVSTLHRAGADFVMSYASMGANAIFNLLERSDILMVDEGLDVFKVKIPPSLVGKSLANSSIRRETRCTVIAIADGDQMEINPDPTLPLPVGREIILIGSVEAENRFLEIYGSS